MSLNNQDNLLLAEDYTVLSDRGSLHLDFSAGRVIILSPLDGQSNFPQGGLYEWGYSGSETFFRVKVATDPNFTNIVQQDDVRAEQLTSTVPVGTDYYIKIIGLIPVSPTVPDEVTGISISSGDTITEGRSRVFTITVETTGTISDAYTATLVSGNATISQSLDEVTITANASTAGQSIEFQVESDADNTKTASRTLTIEQELSPYPDTLQGDYDALQALYTSTKGQGVPTLASVGDRPDIADATYPYMYMINGEIHHLRYDRGDDFIGWENAGAPWKDTTGWDNMTPETMGDAVGITTDVNGRVKGIDMQKVTLETYEDGQITTGNNLVGVLPVQLSNLKRLEDFNIKQNFFHGEIHPDIILNCTAIKRWSFAGQRSEINVADKETVAHIHRMVYYSDHFNASVRGKEVGAYNRFRTDIPDFSDLPNLELVEIRHQYLLGTLPDFINCPSIQAIYIDVPRSSGIDKLDGEIPTSWSNIPLTHSLYLTNEAEMNRYGGAFPSGIASNWTELKNIGLSNCDFEGGVPSFPNSDDKELINIPGNKFTGDFPIEYFNGNNSEINLFRIANNNLSSNTIPDTIPQPTFPVDRTGTGDGTGYWFLSTLDLGYCGLGGALPSWMPELPRVQIFTLTDNNFTGTFPVALFNNNVLKTLRLDGNNFTGTLPVGDWQTPRIIVFWIQGNDFEGEIPPSWISAFEVESGVWNTSVRDVRLNDNRLKGQIPHWWVETGIDGGKLRLYNNQFVFQDWLYDYNGQTILEHYAQYELFPQKPFGDGFIEDVIQLTTPATYSFSDWVSHANDVYQWQQQVAGSWQDLSGEVWHTTNALSTSNAGLYRLKVNNTLHQSIASGNASINDVTLYSKEIQILNP